MAMLLQTVLYALSVQTLCRKQFCMQGCKSGITRSVQQSHTFYELRAAAWTGGCCYDR